MQFWHKYQLIYQHMHASLIWNNSTDCMVVLWKSRHYSSRETSSSVLATLSWIILKITFIHDRKCEECNDDWKSCEPFSTIMLYVCIIHNYYNVVCISYCDLLAFLVEIALVLACTRGHAHNVSFESSVFIGQFLNSWHWLLKTSYTEYNIAHSILSSPHLLLLLGNSK